MRYFLFKKEKQVCEPQKGLQIRSTYMPPNRGDFNDFAQTLEKSLKEKFIKSK